MAVRSTLLAARRIVADQELTIFTVPEQTTVLVKSVYGYSFATATSKANVVLTLPPAAGIGAITLQLPIGDSFRWDGWLALDPTWRLSIWNGANGAIDVVISGTVLPGAALELPGMKPAELGATPSAP